MFATVQITCIAKTSRTDPWDQVAFIGGIDPHGARWRLSAREAISALEDRRWSFFVSQGPGESVHLMVATSPSGEKYLKTEADGEQPDQLLRLPECP